MAAEMVLTKNSPLSPQCLCLCCLISVARAGLCSGATWCRNYQVSVSTSNFQYSLGSHIHVGCSPLTSPASSVSDLYLSGFNETAMMQHLGFTCSNK